MKESLVSIVVCVYNGEKFLKKQLDSIVGQTYKNIEVIIVDDCSADSSIEIIESYVLRYEFITLYKNSVNLGYNKNFEKAVLLANGEFIAISDQDDIWMLNKIERLLASIGNNYLVFSNSAHIDEDDQRTGDRLIFNIKSDKISYQSLILRNFVSGHTILMNKKLVELAVPFPEDNYYDWWIAFVASLHKRIVYLDEILTLYRVHENAVTKKLVPLDAAQNAVALEQYKITTKHFRNVSIYVKATKESLFINKLAQLYTNRLSLLQQIPFFYLLYMNYNRLFLSERKRKVVSKTRFKFVKDFLREIRQIQGMERGVD